MDLASLMPFGGGSTGPSSSANSSVVFPGTVTQLSQDRTLVYVIGAALAALVVVVLVLKD